MSTTEESHDEGIHIGRPRGGMAAADIARSMPISVPRYPSDRQAAKELDDFVSIIIYFLWFILEGLPICIPSLRAFESLWGFRS